MTAVRLSASTRLILLLASLFWCLAQHAAATSLLGSVVGSMGVVLPTVLSLYELQTSNVSMSLSVDTTNVAISSLLQLGRAGRLQR